MVNFNLDPTVKDLSKFFPDFDYSLDSRDQMSYALMTGYAGTRRRWVTLEYGGEAIFPFLIDEEMLNNRDGLQLTHEENAFIMFRYIYIVFSSFIGNESSFYYNVMGFLQERDLNDKMPHIVTELISKYEPGVNIKIAAAQS